MTLVTRRRNIIKGVRKCLCHMDYSPHNKVNLNGIEQHRIMMSIVMILALCMFILSYFGLMLS